MPDQTPPWRRAIRGQAGKNPKPAKRVNPLVRSYSLDALEEIATEVDGQKGDDRRPVDDEK